jgi:hypothetical protein
MTTGVWSISRGGRQRSYCDESASRFNGEQNKDGQAADGQAKDFLTQAETRAITIEAIILLTTSRTQSKHPGTQRAS